MQTPNATLNPETVSSERARSLRDSAYSQAEMLRRYQALIGLSPRDRVLRVSELINEEYSLPQDELRAFTITRLRTWLRMPPEDAAIIASSYNEAMDRASVNTAMRYVAMLQTTLNDFTLSEQMRLADLIPQKVLGTPAKALTVQDSPAQPEARWTGLVRTLRRFTFRSETGAPQYPPG